MTKSENIQFSNIQITLPTLEDSACYADSSMLYQIVPCETSADCTQHEQFQGGCCQQWTIENVPQNPLWNETFTEDIWEGRIGPSASVNACVTEDYLMRSRLGEPEGDLLDIIMTTNAYDDMSAWSYQCD